MTMLFRFHDALPTQAIPTFATDRDGQPRVADGETYFDVEQAAARAGVTVADLTKLWQAYAKEIVGDLATEGETVRDVKDDEEKQLTFEDLTDQELRERAERRMRGSDFSVDEW